MKWGTFAFRCFGLSLVAFLETGCGAAPARTDVPPIDAGVPVAPDPACESVRPLLAGAATAGGEKAFFWRAVAPGPVAKTAYLLGSVHVGLPDFYPLAPVVEAAYTCADALVVEVNTEAVTEEETAQIIATRAVLPAGQQLNNTLSPEVWKKLAGTLDKYDVPAPMLIGLKPWFAAMTLVALRVVEAGYKVAYGIDAHFLKRGDKVVYELESAAFQFALFDDLPPDFEEILLLDAMEGLVQTGGEMDKTVDAWRAGDADAMQEALGDGLTDHPEYLPLYEKLITERNGTMASGIERLLEAHDELFVVVGAGHMVGPEGLVAIFEKKGYAVDQMGK